MSYSDIATEILAEVIRPVGGEVTGSTWYTARGTEYYLAGGQDALIHALASVDPFCDIAADAPPDTSRCPEVWF